MTGRVVRLVIPHKDRLLRCGVALVFTIREANHVEIVILQQCEDTLFEEEWAQNVLEIITVFSARLSSHPRDPKTKNSGGSSLMG